MEPPEVESSRRANGKIDARTRRTTPSGPARVFNPGNENGGPAGAESAVLNSSAD